MRGYMGHYPYVASQLLGVEPVTFTIVRDPVERTISYLKHCKRYHDQHRELSLEEIYGDPFYFPCFIHNHETKIFAMTDEDRLESYMDVIDIDDRRLAIAKENLATGRHPGPPGALRRIRRRSPRAVRLAVRRQGQSPGES